MLSEFEIEKLAYEIYDWCMSKELWEDSCIYFNNKAWATWKDWNGIKGKKINNELYEYENKNPKDYIQYVPEKNILTMSFESLLNHVLNGIIPGSTVYCNQFNKILKKYNLYYEMGDTWNLSLYEIE